MAEAKPLAVGHTVSRVCKRRNLSETKIVAGKPNKFLNFLKLKLFYWETSFVSATFPLVVNGEKVKETLKILNVSAIMFPCLPLT